MKSLLAKFLRFPWGRSACVVGALSSFSALMSSQSYAAPALAVFVFAGVALHGLAVWRDKP